jgi:chromosome segregation ATPase
MSPTSGPTPEQRAIHSLTTELESLTKAVSELRSDLRENTKYQHGLGVQLAGIQRIQETLADDFKLLVKLVRDGNGQPSLMHRLAELEVMYARAAVVQSQHARDIASLQKHLNGIQAARVVTQGQLLAGVAGVIISALMSLGAIIAQLMK